MIQLHTVHYFKAKATDSNLSKSCKGEGKFESIIVLGRKCIHVVKGEFERLFEVEDELEGDMIGLVLTVHKALGLVQDCEEVLLSFQ